MPLIFLYPGLPPSLNGNTRKHWAERADLAKAAKREFQRIVDVQIEIMGVAPTLYWSDLQVKVLFGIHHKKRIDLDNIFAGAKFWIDVLTEMKVITDDNIKIVSSLKVDWKPTGSPTTEIQLLRPTEWRGHA